ncbi:MAG: hypothetical protein KF799_16190 [Bdellovibrionales bacterium]|nr:hypothetical protein [Bdellovibrionales bacterium]
MKKLNMKWKRISLILAAMAGLSTLSFNCAPSMFQAPKGHGFSFSSFDVFAAPKVSPYSLMTSRQTYKTFLNVTGQEGAATTAQQNEYDLRSATLATTDRLTNVNAPLQMAATSLAGEMCNGLLAKEIALPAASRRFFGQVDFARSAAQNTPAAFDAAVGMMATSFWGRAPSSEESKLLNSFYTEFSAGAGTAAAGTRNLYLAACTGMLAAFDTYNY